MEVDSPVTMSPLFSSLSSPLLTVVNHKLLESKDSEGIGIYKGRGGKIYFNY